jgi:hypothetical protein
MPFRMACLLNVPFKQKESCHYWLRIVKWHDPDDKSGSEANPVSYQMGTDDFLWG